MLYRIELYLKNKQYTTLKDIQPKCHHTQLLKVLIYVWLNIWTAKNLPKTKGNCVNAKSTFIQQCIIFYIFCFTAFFFFFLLSTWFKSYQVILLSRSQEGKRLWPEGADWKMLGKCINTTNIYCFRKRLLLRAMK